ncbi:hypothetical protein KP509_39G048800 [Ceratopteris richardii]|uniref:Secreted protein n=1 Tax=Ceratopteris richardii TaxID=49495 RepID=A0A8T2Q132_CERRI|nr:hypothetical protein KP509_39G048800 [Ceratopteris richardii]
MLFLCALVCVLCSQGLVCICKYVFCVCMYLHQQGRLGSLEGKQGWWLVCMVYLQLQGQVRFREGEEQG